MTQRPWLVVGAATRALVQAAARHGHEVCAIDAFADRDTLLACAGRMLRVPLDVNGNLDEVQIPHAVAMSERKYAPDGFRGIVAGNGLDSAHELRTVLERLAPLCGCSGATLQTVRGPRSWAALLQSLQAPQPTTRFDAPLRASGWLLKSASGTGGVHVQPWRAGIAAPLDAYYQRRAPGRAASLLFAAEGGRAWPLGWQWQVLAPTAEQPWRYGGVCTAADMPSAARAAVAYWLDRIADSVPLRGVGSLDFLVEGQTVQLLEINPRPTASIALYPQLDIFGVHVGSVDPARAAAPILADPPALRGEVIFYACDPLAIAAGFDWPHWCADLPAGDSFFEPGDAVCSVHATAANIRSLHARLRRRLHTIARALHGAITRDSARDPKIESERQFSCTSPG